jgi:hypothetical protein
MAVKTQAEIMSGLTTSDKCSLLAVTSKFALGGLLATGLDDKDWQARFVAAQQELTPHLRPLLFDMIAASLIRIGEKS